MSLPRLQNPLKMPKKRAGGADGAAAKKSRTDEIPRMTKVRKTLALPEVLRSVNKLKSSVPRRLCHFGRFAVFAAVPAFFLPCSGPLGGFLRPAHAARTLPALRVRGVNNTTV